MGRRRKEWASRAFGIDPEFGLYSAIGQWVIPPDALGELVDTRRRVSAVALRAARECNHASLLEIEQAIIAAVEIFRVPPVIDWPNTRISMAMMRHNWPTIVDAICAALSGENLSRQPAITTIAKTTAAQGDS